MLDYHYSFGSGILNLTCDHCGKKDGFSGENFSLCIKEADQELWIIKTTKKSKSEYHLCSEKCFKKFKKEEYYIP